MTKMNDSCGFYKQSVEVSVDNINDAFPYRDLVGAAAAVAYGDLTRDLADLDQDRYQWRTFLPTQRNDNVRDSVHFGYATVVTCLNPDDAQIGDLFEPFTLGLPRDHSSNYHERRVQRFEGGIPMQQVTHRYEKRYISGAGTPLEEILWLRVA